MDDLETQLRRYADQVEDRVGEVALPAGSPRRPTSSRRSPLLLAAAAIVLVVIGVAALALRSGESNVDVAEPSNGTDVTSSTLEAVEQVDVPDVVGLDPDAARSRLLDAGLDPEVQFEPSAAAPANTVIGQAPAAGSRLQVGSIVTIRVSSGVADTVPNVLGETQESATAVLQTLGYVVTVQRSLHPADAGIVVDQSPSPGELLVTGDAVQITVSTGPAPELVPVPDVEGLDRDMAVVLLRDAGFVIDSAEVQTASAEIEAGHVIRTDPPANDLVVAGTTVTLVVSAGAAIVEVPQVTDLFADTAITTLRNQGFEVATTFEIIPAGSPGVGRVLAQLPAAFEEAEVGSLVTISVGESPPPADGTIVEVPSVTELFADTAITTVRNQGLEIVTIFETVPVGSPLVGRVLAQSPAAFEEAEVGSVVTLTIGEAS